MSVVRSQLQREVLKLYRNLLRAVTPLPGSTATLKISSDQRRKLHESVRQEFRRQATEYKKTDILRIEAALRRGRRHLAEIEAGNVVGISYFRAS